MVITEAKLEQLGNKLKKANKLAKELVDLNMLNHRRFLAMRSRLAVLTVMHKDELEGRGLNVDRWIRALELDEKQLSALTMGLKRK